jgi:hypothetical protein
MVIGEKSHKGMGNAGKDAVGVTMVPMMLLQSNRYRRITRTRLARGTGTRARSCYWCQRRVSSEPRSE